MNEPTSLNEASSVSETSGKRSKTVVSGLPLSHRQTVLLIGVVIVIAVVLWRRRVNQRRSQQVGDAREAVDSKHADDGVDGEDSGDRITVPQDPDDELEKDAVVIKALRSRGKMGDG